MSEERHNFQAQSTGATAAPFRRHAQSSMPITFGAVKGGHPRLRTTRSKVLSLTQHESAGETRRWPATQSEAKVVDDKLEARRSPRPRRQRAIRPVELRKVRMPLSRAELGRLGSAYWWVVAVAAVFTLARFSEAFLILRAQSIGLSILWAPVVMIVMNIAYALSAYPVGVMSDGVNRVTLLIAGLVFLLMADLFLALSFSILGIAVGVALWGLHMGFTQGLFATLIADASPAELRGTAFGVFNLVAGVALLLASLVAGALWDVSGPQATFLASAFFAILTLVGLLQLGRRLDGRQLIG